MGAKAKMEMFLVVLGTLGSAAAFLFNLLKEIDARFDNLEKKQLETMAALQEHIAESKAFQDFLIQKREADRELTYAKLESLWLAVQHLKEKLS